MISSPTILERASAGFKKLGYELKIIVKGLTSVAGCPLY